MLPLRFIRRIVVVFFIICAATQNLPASKHAKTYAQAQRIDEDSSSSEETNSNFITGNGDSLSLNIPKTVTYANAEQPQNLAVNWFNFWYGKQMAKQQQQQQQQLEQQWQEQYLTNVKRNAKESSQRNVFEPNSRCQRNARTCDYNDVDKYYDVIENDNRNERKSNVERIEQGYSPKTYATFLRNLFHSAAVMHMPKFDANDHEKFDTDDGDNDIRSFYLDRSTASAFRYPEQNVNTDISNIIRSQNYKRHEQQNDNLKKMYLPSISGGTMTNLGDFFKELSRNVQFTEKSQLNKVEEKLLHGDHPLKTLHEKVADKHEGNAEFLHAIRTYRPPQRVRSMLSMSPYGYHGWQYIDPNYMWIGLGK